MDKATTQAKLKFLKYVPVLTLPFYMEYQKVNLFKSLFTKFLLKNFLINLLENFT